MGRSKFDFTDFRKFAGRLEEAASGEFRKELILLLEGLGFEFLRIVEDEIIRRKTMDFRLLLNSFHKGNEENVWRMNENGLTLEVGSNVLYAAFVNDGHWTNTKGIEVRFVPGHWRGHRFIYVPGAKTGMVLRQKWVEGSHYWESAIRIFEKIFPDILDTRLEEWMVKYFNV